MDTRRFNDREEILSFNFWPSFADLMLAIVLILFFVINIAYAILDANIRDIRSKQMAFIDELGRKFDSKPEPESNAMQKNTYILKNKGIVINNESILQRLSFTSNILFPSNSAELSDSGKRILTDVGYLIKENLVNIREIQIQGHADNERPRPPFHNNEDLAMNRAGQVYFFLKDEIKIDPALRLMSITSFGEYKPVKRSDNDLSYNRDRLKHDNSTDELRSLNRRIELLLIYL